MKNQKISFTYFLICLLSILNPASATTININDKGGSCHEQVPNENIFDYDFSTPPKNNISKIELFSFSAQLNETFVEIAWTIHKEPGNIFYTVERSPDNVNFFPIGSVEGKTNPDLDISYSFMDMSPMQGISYYRLQQTDLNGQSKYYPSYVVNNKNALSISLFPNPASSGTIHLSGIRDKTYTSVTVRDITGKIVPAKISLNENGIVDIVIDEYFASQKGIFIIAINDGKDVIYHKLLIK